MKQLGRVNWLILLALAGVLAMAVILLFAKESLTSIGARFMTALAKGDVDTLTKMSYMGNESESDIRKEWTFAVKTAGKYYTFHWSVTSALQADPNTASVRLSVVRNAVNPGAYEENFQLPLVLLNGVWKVDVRGISRDMYPGLPRGLPSTP